MADEMGPAELARALARVEADLGKISEKLDNLGNTFVRRDVFELHILNQATRHDTLAKRVDEDEQRLSDSRKLIWTTLVAPLIIAIVAAIFIASIGVR